ncbi:MAG: phosphoribosylanthranilate isomerase [Planctomycetota bacterium]
MWTKICGFTNSENAISVCRLGVSAIGLNFCAGSRRFINRDAAKRIACSVRESLSDSSPEIIGVFVNSRSEDVAATVSELRLSAVQFHGDEPCSLISDFHRLHPETRIIRAVRVSEDNFNETIRSLKELCSVVPVAACLLDAYSPSQFGGTGQTVSLELAQRYLTDKSLPRLILAGGLTPDNLETVLAQFRPWGLDVASGVESSPGFKDLSQVERFLGRCRGIASSESTLEQSFRL